MKKMFVWFIVMFNMSLSLAGSETGNGGNAVICYDSIHRRNVVSIEMFDYWEMSQHFEDKYELNTFVPENSVEANVLNFLNKVENFDVKRAQGYKIYALEILKNIDQYLVDKNLPDIDDDNPHFEPVGRCEKKQFAIQIKNPLPSEKRFLINKRLWNHPKTGNDVRAGLILHEVIYREFMSRGVNNSDAAREYNFLVASSYIQKTDLANYLALLGKLKLEPVGVVSTWVKFGNEKYIMQITPLHREGNTVKKIKGTLAKDVYLKNKFGKIDSKVDAEVMIEQDVDGQYYFSQQRSRIGVAGYHNINYVYHLFNKGEEYLLHGESGGWQLKFYPNGRLKEGSILPKTKLLEFASKYGAIYCSVYTYEGGDIEFYSDGSLQSCYTANITKLLVNGVSFSPHRVVFGEINQGKLDAASPREKTIWAVQGCKQPLIYKGESINQVVVDELGALRLGETIDANLRSKMPFENLPEIIFQGKSYTSPAVSVSYQGHVRNYFFNPDNCELKARIEIPVSKTDRGLELTTKLTNKDEIYDLANNYCQKVGLAAIAGKNDYFIENKVTTSLPFRVFNLDLGAEEELAFGSNYQKITFNCVGFSIKSLK